MPQVIDPIDEQQQRYVEAVMRGESGRQLAESAGIPVREGPSPPVVFPPPQNRVEPVEHYTIPASQTSANFVRYPSIEDEGIDYDEITRNFGNLPIDQAKQAIQGALRFQSERLYNEKVASGMDPATAAMQLAPYLSRSTLAGVASLSRQAQANTPGKVVTEGGFTRIVKPGYRDVIVPQSALPGNAARKTIHSPGVGIFEYNPETKAWEKSVDFPEKATKYSARRVTVDPATGEVKTVSGDPEDPVIKDFMAKAKKAVEVQNAPSGFSLLKPSTWFGANAPVTAPEMPTNQPSAGVPAAPQESAPSLGQAPSSTRVPASPFKEGARIKSKKNGKFYIVKNGVPVPEE